MAKTREDGYKRKSNVLGWIIFFALVVAAIIQMGVIRLSPGEQAMKDPESALRGYVAVANRFATADVASLGQTDVEKFLSLVDQETRTWFEENYHNRYTEKIRRQGRTEGAMGSGEFARKASVLQDIAQKGFHQTEYNVVKQNKRARSVDLTVRMSNGDTRTVNMRKENDLFYVHQFAGGQ